MVQLNNHVRMLVGAEVVLTCSKELLLLQIQETSVELSARSPGGMLAMLSAAVGQQNTTITLTGYQVTVACLLAVPLPAERALFLEELGVHTMLHLSAMGPPHDLVQTLSWGGKDALHRHEWPLTAYFYSMGSAAQSHSCCRAPLPLPSRRRVTLVTARTNRLIFAEEAKHNFLLLRTGKETPVYLPSNTANDVTLSLKNRTNLLSGVFCQIGTLNLTDWSTVGCAEGLSSLNSLPCYGESRTQLHMVLPLIISSSYQCCSPAAEHRS